MMRTSTIVLLLGIFLGWVTGTVSAQVIETVNLPAVQKTGGMSLMEALQNRQSHRSFSSQELSLQQMSNLLWAAYGINRPNGYRTVPSAHAYHEFDIYIIQREGWFVYNPEKHTMEKMGNEDLREYAGAQPFVRIAPVNLVFVADFDRMTDDDDDDSRKFYSATDVGYISQNVYLWCASEGLGTVVRGQIGNGKAKEALKLRSNQHILLAQTVGYPGE